MHFCAITKSARHGLKWTPSCHLSQQLKISSTSVKTRGRRDNDNDSDKRTTTTLSLATTTDNDNHFLRETDNDNDNRISFLQSEICDNDMSLSADNKTTTDFRTIMYNGLSRHSVVVVHIHFFLVMVPLTLMILQVASKVQSKVCYIQVVQEIRHRLSTKGYFSTSIIHRAGVSIGLNLQCN